MADTLPDRQQAFDNAKDMHAAAQKFLDEQGVIPLLRDYVASKTSLGLAAVEPLVANIVSVLITLIFPVAKSFLQGIADVRKQEQPEFNDLTVEVLNEILGTDLNADDVPVGKGAAGTAARSAVLGKKLYDVLIQMLSPDGVVTPDSGEKAAQAFTGFTMSWSMSSAFLAILGGCIPEFHLDELKELGEELARNLGLARLQRRTLGVLMDQVVQKPYQAQLQKRYRPDRLSEQQYVRALNRSAFTNTYVHDRLAEKGYPDDEIAQLMREYTPHLAEADLLRLLRYGDISEDEAIDELVQNGYPDPTARFLLRAVGISRADSIVSSYVNKIESQYINGFIDEGIFNKLLDAVPWTDEEKQRERDFVGVTLDAPQTTLTFTQMKAGIVGGILDFDYLDQWLINQGYSDEDQLYLEFEVLQALDKTLSKQDIVDAKSARRSARAFAPRATPTITRN